MAKKDLVEIIKSNPGCIAQVDNDIWTLFKQNRPKQYDDWDLEKQDNWDEKNTLICSSDDFKQLGDGGYGSGNCYGGDILQALAKIVGITVKSV